MLYMFFQTTKTLFTMDKLFSKIFLKKLQTLKFCLVNDINSLLGEFYKDVLLLEAKLKKNEMKWSLKNYCDIDLSFCYTT